MNRLLAVFHHPAVARAAQQSSAFPFHFRGSIASICDFSVLRSAKWFSTAAADVVSDDNAQPSKASSLRSPASDWLPSEQPSSSAHSGSAAESAATSQTSLSAPSITASPPGRPSSAYSAALPQPVIDDDDPPPFAIQNPSDTATIGEPQPQLLQVVPTPEGAPKDKLLVRDFIQNSLYHPTLGYFNSPTPPVGSVGGPINYWRIYCKDEFNLMVKRKYEELETSFLTPAELFSPWYGACIARHMVEHRRHHLAMEGQPLLIVELGGGNGTLARDILDWLRDNRPQDYRQTSYTCLEISTSLAARQYDKVVREGGHGGRFHLRRGSGLDPATWGSTRVWDHTFVLMMEVLDNLPHDRVFRRHARDPWQQTVIHPNISPSPSSDSSSPAPTLERGPWVEAGEPLADPLLQRTLTAVYRAPTREQQLDERFNRVLDFILARDAQPTSRDELLWLPTACAAFLELLHSLRPNHSLIAADFDKLPDVKLPGRNAPLVAQKVGGRNIDHNTLLLPWGTADIFFPTDFDALCDLYRATAQHVWGPGGTALAEHPPHQPQQSGRANPTASASASTPQPPGSPPTSQAAPSPAGTSAGEAAAAAAAAGSGPGGEEVSYVGEVNAEHFRQGAVIKRYREMFNTATICAFNPMVDDFVNARFFFGDSKNRFPPGQRPPTQQSKHRLPQAPPPLTTGIRAHIPAAPAAKVKARLQQQQQQPQGAQIPYGNTSQHHHQAQEPVLGGRRQRRDGASGGSSSSSSSSSGVSGGVGDGGRGRGPRG